MQAKILVAYKSRYGSTQQYARWIAEDLGADLREHREVNAAVLRGYDCVVYGGGLYAGGILGAGLVAKNPCSNLVVFTVGAADPATTDYTKILGKNFPPEARQPLRVFHLRGIIDYTRMTAVHRGMMALMKKTTLDRKKPEEWNEEDRMFAETYGGSFGVLDRASTGSLAEYVHGLFEEGSR